MPRWTIEDYRRLMHDTNTLPGEPPDPPNPDDRPLTPIVLEGSLSVLLYEDTTELIQESIIENPGHLGKTVEQSILDLFGIDWTKPGTYNNLGKVRITIEVLRPSEDELPEE